MRAILRLVIEEISDEDAIRVKRRIEEMVAKMPGSTVEIQLLPALGLSPPPPPPAPGRGGR